MSVKCGVCGNWERFSASAEIKLDLTVDCDGGVLSHDLDRILSKIDIRPTTCADCGSRKLVESDFISDSEWESQISQAMDRRRLQQQANKGPVQIGGRKRRAS
jgi:hypothetical protein